MGFLGDILALAVKKGGEYLADKAMSGSVGEIVQKKYDQSEANVMKKKLAAGQISQQEYYDYKRDRQAAIDDTKRPKIEPNYGDFLIDDEEASEYDTLPENEELSERPDISGWGALGKFMSQEAEQKTE